MNSWTLSLHLH